MVACSDCGASVFGIRLSRLEERKPHVDTAQERDEYKQKHIRASGSILSKFFASKTTSQSHQPDTSAYPIVVVASQTVLYKAWSLGTS